MLVLLIRLIYPIAYEYNGPNLLKHPVTGFQQIDTYDSLLRVPKGRNR